jgi:WD40 repeat protein
MPDPTASAGPSPSPSSSTLDPTRPDDPGRRLRRRWRHGRPELAEVLAELDAASPAAAVALLCDDQWRRWRAGERVPAEVYLGHRPDWEAADTALDLIYGEFLVREELGEAPELAEFVRRFPRFEGGLRRQVELHRAVGPLGRAVAGRRRDDAGWPIVPGHEVLGVLGRGGMGVVYKARQVRLDRLVALKMLPMEAEARPESLERFRAEAAAVARLQHPNIVQIHEVGEADGAPYFALELVEGRTLAQKFAGTAQEPRLAARLVETLARAMDFAHRRGVVHRDLKPANVLLTAEGVPKVADFGLAKRIDAEAARTRTGAVVGTPSYMAPEQAEARGDDVGPATDIYAMGAILYELLTGRPPFHAESPLETVRQVVSQAPLPPSRFRRDLPRDVETICLKCLEKEPSKRYATADDLAEDLRRFQADLPVRARRIGLLGRARRWCRRERKVAALVASVVALLLVLGVGATIAALWLRDERDVARTAKHNATEELWKSYQTQARADRVSGEPGRRASALAALAKATRIRPSAPIRDEAIACLALADLHARDVEEFAPGGWTVKAIDARLGRVAIADDRGHVRILRWSDRVELARIDDPNGTAWQYKFDPDGRFLAPRYAASDNEQRRRFRVWDARDGSVVLEGPPGGECGDVDFSPDGRLMAVVQPDASIVIFELPSLRRAALLPPRIRPDCIAFRPDGRAVAVSGGKVGSVEVRAIPTGDILRTFAAPIYVRGVAWRGDGRLLAAACGDFSVRVWLVETGEPQATLARHTSEPDFVAFNRRGDRLLSTGWDGSARLWDPLTRTQLVALSGISRPVQFADDDRTLVGVECGGKVARWDVDGGEYRLLHGQHGAVKGPWSVDYSPDGRLLASASIDGLRLWDAAEAVELDRRPIGESHRVLFDSDGRRLLALAPEGLRALAIERGDDRAAARLSPPAGPPLYRRSARSGGYQARLWPGGGAVALIDGRGGIVVFDLGLGRAAVRATYPAPSMAAHVAVSPDGRFVATGTWHGSGYQVVDAATGRVVLDRPDGDAQVDFSPDGRWLVAGTARSYRFWKVGAWTPGPELYREGAALPGPLAFSRDGSLLAVARTQSDLQLVDPADARVLATLTAPDKLIVSAVAIRPDNGQLAAATENQVIQLWDLARIRRQLAAMGLDWPR